jgi:hypothetical protein
MSAAVLDRPEAARRWTDFAIDTPGSQSARVLPVAQWIHSGELDRRKRPYILHPVGVASIGLVDWYGKKLSRPRLEELGYGPDELTAVLLGHDMWEHIVKHKHPAVRTSAQHGKMMLRSRGVSELVQHGIEGLTYIPKSDRISLSQQVEEQALKIRDWPGAREMKPFDIDHNTLPARLYPYLPAKPTVHSIWKYLNVCIIAEMEIPENLKRLPAVVQRLPGVRDMLEGNLRLDDPPKYDTRLNESLELYETAAVPLGGLCLSRV